MDAECKQILENILIIGESDYEVTTLPQIMAYIRDLLGQGHELSEYDRGDLAEAQATLHKHEVEG